MKTQDNNNETRNLLRHETKEERALINQALENARKNPIIYYKETKSHKINRSLLE